MSWARIDRAAFQYHYYTALPFVILALAYLVAELWHGPSRRTWLAVRLAGAAAIVAPAALWLFSRPLCAVVGVERVNPGSQACPAVIPDLVLTLRTAGLLGVVVVGAIVISRGLLTMDRDDAGSPIGIRQLAIGGVALAVALAVVSLLPDTPLITLNAVPVEPIALLVSVPLVYLAAQVLAARDARRYVVGLIAAVVGWFVVFYPNIAALPLPSTVVNAYQGLLPTYLYAFQFPISQVERSVNTPLFSPTLAVLTIGIGVTCVVVAYSASVWRLALAESNAADRAASSSDDADDPRPDGRRRLRDLGPEAFRERAGGRQPADHEAVIVLDLGRDARPAELLRAGLAGGAHLLAQARVADQLVDGDGELARLARRHQQGFAPAPDDALVAVDVGAHDRRAGGHRLEQHDAERLAAGRRRGVHVRGPEQLRLGVVRDAAEELHALQPARGHVAPSLPFLRPGADHQEACLRTRLAQDPVGLEQVQEALARLVAPHEQHVRRAVLPAGDGTALA